MVGTGSLAEDVFKDTIWMDRQNTGPEKGNLDAINDAGRTDTNVVCVPDFQLRISLAIMRYVWLVGRVHAVGRSCVCMCVCVCVCVCVCSRAFDRNHTANFTCKSNRTLRFMW